MIDTNAYTQLLAKSDKKKDIFIPLKSRYLNTMVIGAKNSGKTHKLLPIMAKQDIENKECGATFIVGKKDIAFFLYTLAKKNGRNVILLKPSTSMEADGLLWQDKYDYDYVSNNVINYKDAIRKKSIVIIDMEYSKYRGRSLRATAMLLLQLQLDMHEWIDTLKRPHFVYIDDSQYYLPFIEVLLTNAEEYNVGTTLFIQSRSQFKQKDINYASLIDNNVRSTILMNGLTLYDIEYYQKQFYEYNINTLMNRKYGNVIYETIDGSNMRRNGTGDLIEIELEYREELEKEALRFKKNLTRKKRKSESAIKNNIDSHSPPSNTNEDEADSDVSQLNTANKDNKEPFESKPAPKKESNLSKRKSEEKKLPKQIVADNFNRNTIKYIICDNNFDYDDEY